MPNKHLSNLLISTKFVSDQDKIVDVGLQSGKGGVNDAYLKQSKIHTHWLAKQKTSRPE